MQKKENNKWLLRKISGSRGRYAIKPDYSETRHKKYQSIEDLPKRESIGKGHSFLDTSLVKRWLYKQVGRNFDEIYSEFLTRIQPKYKEKYKNCIYDYVARFNSEDGLRNKHKPFFICNDSNQLKKNKEKEKGAIENELGKFYFDKEEKIWESTGYPKLQFKENLKYLSHEQIVNIQELLKKKERLELKAIEKINDFAEKYKVKHVINGRKALFRISFKQVTKIVKFDLYFEIAGVANKDWIVSFSDFFVDDVFVKKY